MAEPFRIPKHEVQVEVCLPGRDPIEVKLFLSECAESHSGVERPSDLMNGPGEFIPAQGPKGKFIFLHRDALVAVSVAEKYEFAGDVLMAVALRSEQAVQADVEVVMEDETRFEGTIAYLMPEGSRRLQDYLNQAGHYLILRDGETVRLLNKNRIVYLSVKADNG